MLSIYVLVALFISAAVIGDTVNYWIGRLVGPKVFTNEEAKLFKKKYLNEAHAFFKRHGGKAIFLARFIPVIRSFAPFVAGIGSMSYRRFIIYNLLGGISWVMAFLMGGYFFGGIPFVKANFSLVIYGIILISIVPLLLRAAMSRKKS